MVEVTDNVGTTEQLAAMQDAFDSVPDLASALGTDEGLWYKKRLSMENIIGRQYILTRAEWRDRKTGGYYILHLTNIQGAQGTVTTSAPTIKNKLNALINRELFPVRVAFSRDGASFNMVNPED